MATLPLKLLDRAKEACRGVSTGVADSIILQGPADGFVAISGIGDGTNTYYTLQDAHSWEVGLATYATGAAYPVDQTSYGRLIRGEILASSNSGNAISLASDATADVFITLPADKSIAITSGAVLQEGSILFSDNGSGIVDGSANLTYSGSPLTLTVNSGNLSFNTGNLDQLIFTDNIVKIGERAVGEDFTSSLGVAIGYYAGGKNAGTRNIAIGHRANYNNETSYYVCSVGDQAGLDSHNTNFSTNIGYVAGYNSSGTTQSNFGMTAGYMAKGEYLINIGYKAGQQSVGDNSVYIGQLAGYKNEGNNNIEIVTNSGIINNNFSNRVNIENVILSDTTNKKVAIGDVGTGSLTTALEPNAILDVITTGAIGTSIPVFRVAGTGGSLISTYDNVSTGVIFSVSNVDGLPLIAADASGDVTLIENGRYVGIATGTPQYQLDVNGTGNFASGVLVANGAASIDSDGNATFKNLVSDGNLTVSGTLTYIDSTTVTIGDKQLELASNSGAAVGNDTSVHDGGLVLKSTDGDKKWTWQNNAYWDEWLSSEHVHVTGNKALRAGPTGSYGNPLLLYNWTNRGNLVLGDGPHVVPNNASGWLIMNHGWDHNGGVISGVANIDAYSGNFQNLTVSGTPMTISSNDKGEATLAGVGSISLLPSGASSPLEIKGASDACITFPDGTVQCTSPTGCCSGITNNITTIETALNGITGCGLSCSTFNTVSGIADTAWLTSVANAVDITTITGALDGITGCGLSCTGVTGEFRFDGRVDFYERVVLSDTLHVGGDVWFESGATIMEDLQFYCGDGFWTTIACTGHGNLNIPSGNVYVNNIYQTGYFYDIDVTNNHYVTGNIYNTNINSTGYFYDIDVTNNAYFTHIGINQTNIVSILDIRSINITDIDIRIQQIANQTANFIEIIDINNNMFFNIDANGDANLSGCLNASGCITTTGDLTVGGDINVDGNLNVSGTLTYIDSTTVTIADKQLELGSNSGTAIGNDTSVHDGGLVLKSTDGDKKWTWQNNAYWDEWLSSEHVHVTGNKALRAGPTGSYGNPLLLYNWTNRGNLVLGDGPHVVPNNASGWLIMNHGVDHNGGVISGVKTIDAYSGNFQNLTVSGTPMTFTNVDGEATLGGLGSLSVLPDGASAALEIKGASNAYIQFPDGTTQSTSATGCCSGISTDVTTIETALNGITGCGLSCTGVTGEFEFSEHVTINDSLRVTEYVHFHCGDSEASITCTGNGSLNIPSGNVYINNVYQTGYFYDVDVTNNLLIDNNLYVTGNVYNTNINTTGYFYNIDITNTAIIDNNLFVYGNIYNNAIYQTGHFYDIDVTNNVLIDNDLYVTGNFYIHNINSTGYFYDIDVTNNAYFTHIGLNQTSIVSILDIRSINITDIDIRIQQIANQTANFMSIVDINNNEYFTIDASGDVNISGCVNSSGCITSSGLITAATGIELRPNTPAVTTNKIYNVGGALYFNGSAVDGDTTYTAGTGLTLVGTEFNTADTGNFASVAIGTEGYIYHSGDTDTYIQFTDDEIQIAAGGRTYIKIEEDSVDKLIINHSALDIDLQVKGDNDANLIRTDAANDRIGIGKSDPDYKLDVVGVGSFESGILSTGLITAATGITLQRNTPATTTDKLYNVGGALYFNGSAVDGDTTYTAGTGLTLVGTEFNTAGTGSFDRILFDDDKIRLGKDAGTDDGAHAIHIGEYAGFGQGTAASNVNIGYAAGYQHGGGYSISIGHTAGYQADNSAEFGIYLGYHAGRSSDSARGIFLGRNAGKNCAGDDNIEIVHYGAETSILDGYSNKIHIENTIVGDTDARRLAVGFVGSGDVVPDATLEIKPKEHTDIGLIVQGDTSHSANLTEWQNSSETVLASVSADGSISGNIITASSAIKTPLITNTDGATVTCDLNSGNVHTVTLGGNRIIALTNATVGQKFMTRLVQDGTGSRTVTWFNTIKWAGGSAPTLTTTADKADILGFLCTAVSGASSQSGSFDGFVVGQNI